MGEGWRESRVTRTETSTILPELFGCVFERAQFRTFFDNVLHPAGTLVARLEGGSFEGLLAAYNSPSGGSTALTPIAILAEDLLTPISDLTISVSLIIRGTVRLEALSAITPGDNPLAVGLLDDLRRVGIIPASTSEILNFDN